MILGNNQLMKSKSEIVYETGKYQFWNHDSSGALYYSSDYGANWTRAVIPGFPSYGSMSQMAVSKDGKYVMMHAGYSSDAYVAISSDYGVTWANATTLGVPQSYNQTGLAVSDTGQYQHIQMRTICYISDDYGASWIRGGNGGSNGRAFSMSGDGQYRLMDNYAALKPLVSSDFGVSWVSQTEFSSAYGAHSGISRDGKYMYVCQNNSYLWRSADYGVTFVNSLRYFNFRPAISWDGQYVLVTGQAAGQTAEGVSFSNDYGATWIDTLLGACYNGGAVSGETGQYMVIGIYQVGIYVSNDWGDSWILKVSNGGHFMIPAISSDGKYIAICLDSSRYVYLSNDYGATFTSYGGTNAHLSNAVFSAIN